MHDELSVRTESVIDAVMHQDAKVAGDVFEIDVHTWAIHGLIPVDGDVILAEFDRPEAARAVLDRLAMAELAAVAGNSSVVSGNLTATGADRPPEPSMDPTD